ncbi:HAD family hydrolase [bacterium]|nr:MAG: HAD family hydrolase [bacterium]
MPGELGLGDFRAMLFDVDGTLVDSIPIIVRGIGDTFERFANRRPTEEEVLGKIGVPLAVQLGMYSVMDPTAEEIDAMSRYAIGRFEDLAHLEREFAPAVETLRLAKMAGLQTALVTSKSRVELDTFFRRFEAAHLVDAAVCASDVTHPKPDPESARLACERLGVRPEEAAMVGDSVYDLRCAREAGLTAIAVGYGAASVDTLRAESPDLLFDTPEALLEWARASYRTPCPARS